MFFRPLESLGEEVLVELEAVLVHRVDVAQARNDEVDDRAARRDYPAAAEAAAVAAAAVVVPARTLARNSSPQQ